MTQNEADEIRVEACVPDDDQPHAFINGHHVSWCPCGSQDREQEPGPWDAWGSEDPWK